MTPEQRLSLLENRCRLQSRALVAVVLLGSLALFLGADDPVKPQKLQVTELEVVDAEGNVRILLGGSKQGHIEHFWGKFTSADGKSSALISDYGQLSLRRNDGWAALSAGSKGASLQLSAPGLRPRAMLYAHDDHSGIQLRDTNGEVSFIQETPRIDVPLKPRVLGPGAVDPFAP